MKQATFPPPAPPKTRTITKGNKRQLAIPPPKTERQNQKTFSISPPYFGGRADKETTKTEEDREEKKEKKKHVWFDAFLPSLARRLDRGAAELVLRCGGELQRELGGGAAGAPGEVREEGAQGLARKRRRIEAVGKRRSQRGGWGLKAEAMWLLSKAHGYAVNIPIQALLVLKWVVNSHPQNGTSFEPWPCLRSWFFVWCFFGAMDVRSFVWLEI